MFLDKKYLNEKKNIMKIVKEKIDNFSKISEGLRIKGVTYDNIKLEGGNIFAGKEGILGNNDILIPWDLVKNLVSKYTNK